jgi:DNA-binding response OmpR family regulator
MFEPSKVALAVFRSNEGRQNMLEAMQAGSDDYLVKPFDELELKARLLVGKRILDLQDELVSARESIRAPPILEMPSTCRSGLFPRQSDR